MLATTKGFVFKTTPYSETSVIAKVFTWHAGIQSYIVKGVRSAKGRNKQNMLQPLSYVDIAYYHNAKSEIQYIKELKPAKQWNSIPIDCSKTAIIFFMTELLYKTVREEEPNQAMFNHIARSVDMLDSMETNIASFPITFMLETARYLGIEPLNNYSVSQPLFNLNEGEFVGVPSAFADTKCLLDAEQSLVLHQYMSNHYTTQQPPFQQRNTLLKSLIDYYKTHFDTMGNFQSHYVLHQVLQ